jgi:hypothetical protein
LNAEIAVHHHDEDDHGNQGNDEFGSKIHLSVLLQGSNHHTEDGTEKNFPDS